MYVQWLLEFLWRVFVQGPLLFIQFLTGDNLKTGGLFSFTIQYSAESKYFVSYLSFSIFMAISLLILFSAFLIRIAYITAKSNGMTTKYEIIQLLKRAGVFVCIILCLSLLLGLLFFLMDQINVAITKTFTPIGADKFSTHSFSDYIYKTLFNNSITWDGVSVAKNANYFVPSQFSIIDGDKNGNALNFIVIILFVFAIAGFLFWMVYTVFQKMLEILFLGFGLPFTMSFSLSEVTDMRWKIWVNEIFNKIIIFIVLMVLYRIFVYIYIDAYNVIWNAKGGVTIPKAGEAIGGDTHGFNNPRLNILYIMFIIVMATGSSIVFLNKYIAKRNLEHIGIFKSIQSYQQTRNFMETYKNEKFIEIKNSDQVNALNDINANISSIKESIQNDALNQHTDNGIEKVKIFS